jgi:GDP-mannose 6-dehydrogenase
MSVFAEDRILNVSKAYLRPGFAFGGSCLPKDVRALVATSAKGAGPLALLHAVLDSNERRIADAAQRIVDSGVKRVAFLGLTFKSGTDDLRESPYLLLAGRLIQSGLSVSVHEPDLAEAQLLGANLAYAESHLPKLRDVLAPSIEGALEGADGVVLCKRTVPLEELRLALEPFEHVFDLEHRL